MNPAGRRIVYAGRTRGGVAEWLRRAEHGQMAELAMRYLASPQIAPQPQTGGVLLADQELPGR